MNCYEYTFIAKQDLVENQNEKVLEKYQEIINKNWKELGNLVRWDYLPSFLILSKNFVQQLME